MAPYFLSVLSTCSGDPHTHPKPVGFCWTPLHNIPEEHSFQHLDAGLPSKKRQGRETGLNPASPGLNNLPKSLTVLSGNPSDLGAGTL